MKQNVIDAKERLDNGIERNDSIATTNKKLMGGTRVKVERTEGEKEKVKGVDLDIDSPGAKDFPNQGLF